MKRKFVSMFECLFLIHAKTTKGIMVKLYSNAAKT